MALREPLLYQSKRKIKEQKTEIEDEKSETGDAPEEPVPKKGAVSAVWKFFGLKKIRPHQAKSEGIYGQNWDVTYNPDSICAVKGSSVTISCSYTYPSGHRVETVYWTKNKNGNRPDLSEEPAYRGRFQYLGDKQSDCSMKLTDVRERDAVMYLFRFETDKTGGKWTGLPGVQLSVTDLQVETPERVVEGDTVTLKCRTNCSLSNTTTFIWYKNEYVLTRKNMKNNELSFQSVSSEDRGSYMCAVQGHENLPSPAVTLTVIYPPRNTTVSVNASGEIVAGSSVTLTCSSDANPPQINYTWYKENVTSPVGYGQSYIINNIQSNNSGLYYCEAQNKHGSQRTTAVPIKEKAISPSPEPNHKGYMFAPSEISNAPSVIAPCSRPWYN
ncbi:B-cell receptor CD22-like [Chanos chanos]|uniref:B-cell receptor CD22-like n=1 Tax=Chanos chanos TaxID=29144 RepID=A0A6J2VRZ5_CHACN|nr:B-cell receptor CD22-like [Chanos chanos]